MADAKASIVVRFGDSVAVEDQFAVIELDDEMNGENIATFAPRQDAWFLVHLGPGLRVIGISSSSGLARVVSPAARLRKTRAQFDSVEATVELPYYPSGGLSTVWYGSDAATTPVSGRTLHCQHAPAIGDLSYSVSYTLCCLEAPPQAGTITGDDDEWPVLVVVHVA
ncbi:MAG: hypothetical protein LBU39_01915 [Desulfobulbaceae bacterium]|jgi:hypothetical protein|nr:hypothetical protein [Desulfobulbaceae bacterium]